MKTEKALNTIVDDCCLYLEKLGYDKHGVWGTNYGIYCSIVKYQRTHGSKFYDTSLADNYLAEKIRCYDEGKISRSVVNNTRRAVSQLSEFALTGKITILSVKKGSKYKLCDFNEELLNAFMTSKQFHPNTKEDFKWAIRYFLFYFQERQKNNPTDINESDLKEFVLYASGQMTYGSLNNMLGYIRQFVNYLTSKQLFTASAEILKYCGKREFHVSGYVSDEDLEKILSAIDIDTKKGKRNKAIILLGSELGIRAADVASLKLSDIDWRNGKIILRQGKTNKATEMPLTEEVAIALQDYILNARPDCDFEEVFLRINAPFQPLSAGSSIESVFEFQCKIAGIKRVAFDGRAFHGLRRRLGRKMLLNGEQITTISQVLGHSNTCSAKQYLKIDGDHLKNCALDFQGIGVERRSLL